MSFPRIVLLCYVIYLFWVAQLQITLYWQSEPDDGISDQKAETEIRDFLQQIPVRPVLTADSATSKLLKFSIHLFFRLYTMTVDAIRFPEVL